VEPTLRYRGREITEDDIAFLRGLIAASPSSSRFALSKQVCEAWNWVQPNGRLRDMVCRSLMLRLHREGRIELPPPRCKLVNHVVHRRRPAALPADLDRSPIETGLRDLGALEWRQVRRTPDEGLLHSLLAAHHYLGPVRLVGEHLGFPVLARGRPIACFAWSSPPHKLRPRDRFIGWSMAARDHNRHLLAYNPRFLILPWVRVPHLASHLLGQMARRLPGEWQRVYGHSLVYLETFVDTERFAGTCYHAANWLVLGRTMGRGNNAPTWQRTRSIKEVLGYPLSKDFRERLGRLP
jgi:phage FluMu protein Com